MRISSWRDLCAVPAVAAADSGSATRLRAVAALAAGALLPFAFAPLGWFPLAVLAPALLFALWLGQGPRRAAWYGGLFGIGQFGVGVSWVWVAIHDFGQSGVVTASLLTAAFVLILSLYPALTGFLAACLARRRSGALTLVLLFPAVWTLGEWFRGWFLTGFPWLSLGYSQLESPLAGFAPLFGVFGLGWLVALSAGLLLWLVRERRALPVVVALAVVWGAGAALRGVEWGEGAGEPLDVAVIQGNLPQDTKWDPERVVERLETYASLSLRQFGTADLVVWPENAVTLFYHQLREDYFRPLLDQALADGTDLILGVPVLAADGVRYYTSLMSLGGNQAFYHKHHLVPFGEYVPLEALLRGLIGFFDLPMSGFIPGPARQPPLAVAGQQAAPTVCYEDAFGDAVRRTVSDATLLVNGSNNAWYGDSMAPHQHLQISRMRALETARPLVRATTNGISALVDHRGRVVARSPQFERHTLTGRIEPRSGATPYVRWGDTPLLLAALLVAGIAGWRLRRG